MITNMLIMWAVLIIGCIIFYHFGQLVQQNRTKKDFYAYMCRNCTTMQISKSNYEKLKDHDDIIMTIIMYHTELFPTIKWVGYTRTLERMRKEIINGRKKA